MNSGEKDELITLIKLSQLRDNGLVVPKFGIIESVGYPNEYGSLPLEFDLNSLLTFNSSDLTNLARSLGISKASGRLKADTIINGMGVSIKSNKKAPPALVNHTTRPGFEFAAAQCDGNIKELDKIVEEYWTLRKTGKIGEDIKNNNPISPFVKKRAVLEPFLNYFLFRGTGNSLSKLPAKYILSFTNPLDMTTWSVYDPSHAVDVFWDKLVFSLRAKKGMPNGYPDNVSNRIKPKLSSVNKWTKYIDGHYRGALHIRATN